MDNKKTLNFASFQIFPFAEFAHQKIQNEKRKPARYKTELFCFQYKRRRRKREDEKCERIFNCKRITQHWKLLKKKTYSTFNSYYLNITIESVRVVLLSRFRDEIRVESDFVWLLLRMVYKLDDPQCWWLLYGPPAPPAPLPPSLPLRLITDDDCEVSRASSCLSHAVSHGLDGLTDNLVLDIDLPMVRSSGWLFFDCAASSVSLWLFDIFSTSPWWDGQLSRRFPAFLPPLL